MNLNHFTLSRPFGGVLHFLWGRSGVRQIYWREVPEATSRPLGSHDLPGLIHHELRSYFEEGKELTFPVDLGPSSVFFRDVWRCVERIPFGQVLSYGEVAQLVGRPGGQRAVGQALNKNPLLLRIPCHRVISKQGLGGYVLGDRFKGHLLSLERTVGGGTQCLGASTRLD